MSLLDDLRAAERGSPELGARVLTAVTGVEHVYRAYWDTIFRVERVTQISTDDPTSSTDAAIELVESKGFAWMLFGSRTVEGVVRAANRSFVSAGHTPALALLAALVAAMGVDA